MPLPDQTTAPGAVQRERDAWVQAIHRLCSDWKRKSMSEHTFMETMGLRHLSITEEDTDTDLESSGAGNMSSIHPPADYENADPSSNGDDHLSAGDTSQSYPSADITKPVPKPRGSRKTTGQVVRPAILPPVTSPTSPGVVALSSPTSPQPSPVRTSPSPSSTVPESLDHESGSSVVKGPSPPRVPAPPPLPFRMVTNSKKPTTKAFHWDVLGSDKVTLSIVS